MAGLIMTSLAGQGTARSYVRYSDDVETIAPGEQETIDKIIAGMAKGGQLVREKHGRSLRTSHAKAQGLLRGELRVQDGLPEYLRQGLFAEPRTYPVIVRLSHVPGDLDDDRKVSAPRGMSLKVFGVEGEKLPLHQGETTQDFVLDTGKVFNAIDAKTFLPQIAPLEATAPLTPQPVKGAVSAVSRAANAMLGGESAALDFFGHPFLHPMSEAYYSQVPIRYGDYIAKLSVTPDTPALKALQNQKFEPQDYDGLRTATVEFFRNNPAEFEIGIQLCTDLKTMPVENANKGWPEDESPYQPVARLFLPAQDAYSAARRDFVEGDVSFCPAHSLAAHRPLGSIMRARMQAYEILGKARRQVSGRPQDEPKSADAMPG